jgi:hypothetical protein
MTRLLTQLRIDEVSSVDEGAGEGVKVMLYKRDAPQGPQGPLLFNDIIRKADASDPLRGPREEPDDDKVSPKLRAMIEAIVTHAPIVVTGRHGKPDITLNREQTGQYLIHTPHGRRLAEHLNNFLKGETEMPTVDIMKLHNPESVIEVCKNISGGSMELSEEDFTKMVTGHAHITKQPFEKVFSLPDVQRAYAVVREAGHLQALRYGKAFPNLMSVEPVSVVVGDTSVSDDSWKASDQLTAKMEEQRRLAPWMTATQAWEKIYADPGNKSLVYRAHKLPTTSSVNTDYLER